MPPRLFSRIHEWWSGRTSMERRCTVLCVAVSILCVLLTIAIIVLCVLYRNSDICLTEGCVAAAHEILRSMDLSVDPCGNFYDFVCGKYIKETKIPDETGGVSRFQEIGDSLTDRLRSIVEESSHPGEARSYKIAKTLFKSCMDTASIEKVGLTRVKDLLKKMGGWPVLEGDSWDESKFTWKDAILKINKQGFDFSFLFSISIVPDFKNSDRMVLYLDEASLSLKREYLVKGLDDKLVAALYNYSVDISKIFGADAQRATNELKEGLKFEIRLADISLPVEESRDVIKSYNPMSAKELETKYPFFQWSEIFRSILPPAVGGINDDDVIIVAVPEYFNKLEMILKETPKRVQANYLFLRAVKSAVSLLTDDLRALQLKLATALYGITEMEPRWKQCVRVTTESVTLAVGSQYVKKYFKEDEKKSAMEMVSNIREEMYKNLETIDWMDDETRKGAIEKAKSMATHIGYPDELLDENKLDRYYEKLAIADGEHYMEAMLKVGSFYTNVGFGALREPVNKTDWLTHGNVVQVNALYNLLENSIQFTAGILQGAFFSYDRPNYLNYGGIGFVIGHEITHGFDDQGRKFDKEGNLVDWWQPETAERYLKKAACIVQQYGNYTAEQVGMKLNGVLTQGENIADNGGAKLAYQAYNSWARRHGSEKRLPGLEKYTTHQMFWISAANIYCSKYRLEVLKHLIVSDPHSPAEFRVQGTLSNRAEFDNDFGCTSGSKMNPTDKCQVW